MYNKFMIFYIILLIVAFIAFKLIWQPWRLYKWYADNFKKQGYKVLEVPFRPFGVPMLEYYNMSKDVDDAFALIKEQYPNYDVVLMNMFNTIILDFANPDIHQEFLSAEKMPNYSKTEIEIGNFKRMIGNGLASSEGNVWKMKKKVLQQVFNFNFLKQITPKLADLADEVLDKMEKQSQGQELAFDVFDYTIELAGDTMLSCFFGKKLSDEKIEGDSIFVFLRKLLDGLVQQTVSTRYGIFGVKYLELGLNQTDREVNRKLSIYKAWAKKLIKERIEQIKEKKRKVELTKEPNDMIQAIVRNNLKEDKKEGELTYSEEDILDEFNTFFFAGVQTSSVYLVMMIYLVVQHPEVEKKVRQEIKEYMAEDDYSFQNMKKLTYIENVEKEVTRFYGPGNGNASRAVLNDHQLKGIPIKKGTMLGAQPIGFHFSEKYYKNPKEFRPERWEEECNSIPAYAVGGFSGGPRTCIGKHLARTEAKIGLIKFMKRYQKIELPIEKIRLYITSIYQPERFKTKLVKVN